MPFGIRKGPAYFQRCLASMLGNTPRTSVYIDDIIIFSDDFQQQHLNDLETVLLLLRQHHLMAKPKKAVLCRNSLQFLGYWIGGGQISHLEVKVSAFKKYPKPTSKKSLRAFLGDRVLTEIYSKLFQHHYLTCWRTHPTNSTGQQQLKTHSTNCEEPYSRSCPFSFHPDLTDHSLSPQTHQPKGIGAVLSQKKMMATTDQSQAETISSILYGNQVRLVTSIEFIYWELSLMFTLTTRPFYKSVNCLLNKTYSSTCMTYAQ